MKRLAVLCAFALCGSAAAANGPGVQERIVPGEAIGNVRLGMTIAQVRKVLGRPEAVISRRSEGFTTWIEYSWSYTTWRVAFRVTRSTSRVVTIRSSVRTERTPEGIGVGSLEERVKRTYRIECGEALAGRGPLKGIIGHSCVLGKVGRRTAFLVQEFCGNRPTAGRCAERDTRWAVSEVAIVERGEDIPW